jgi:hypothetical protein
MKNNFRIKLFKTLQKAHVYGGLFGSAFMILMGITALNFQHHFFTPQHNTLESYQEEIHFTGDLSADSLALEIQDSLGIFGNIVSWEFHSDTAGYLDFLVKRPGYHYRVSLNRKIPLVKVEPVKTGFGDIIYELHKSRGAIGQVWYFDLWTVYKQVAVVAIFLSIVISIYFWFKKSVKTKQQWGIVIASFTLFITLILAICVIG